MADISRRKFMKKAFVAGAAITAFPTVWIPKAKAAWSRNTAVHPHVDNLRVVGITDDAMTREQEPVAPWKRQDELVNTDTVWENMDKLASGLSETRDPGDAWRTVFVKPPRKSWSDTVVAIKTNNIGRQHTRSAVMSKVCRTLTQTMGVKPANIHIYDACHGSSMGRKAPFAGLPEGVRVEGTWGGSSTFTDIPPPSRHIGGEAECLKYLVDNTVDILVNIAMCKGHSSRFGGYTMTMKNHFGTFSPSPGHTMGSTDYLMAINQTPEILGPMDKKSGKVLYPRQQLCIIDALWASEDGPTCNTSHQPNFLAMGVMAPVLDYQVATKFRGIKMGWEPNHKVTRRMLSDFGYSEGDLPQGGDLIEIS